MTLKIKSSKSILPSHHANEAVELAILPTIDNQISNIPKTRYYGSKRKLLRWLFETVKGMEFETVLDVFGGTASVSRLFQDMKKDVTYNDAFGFNLDVARTVLATNPAMNREDFIALLRQTRPRSGFITKTYKNMYFTHQENRWLDGFMMSLGDWGLNPEQQSLCLFALYQACLKKRPFNLFHRANLNLRTRTDIKRSFGNYTTWERSFFKHMIETYDELTSEKRALVKSAKILPATDASKLNSGFDLVYIDPPYVSLNNKKNRDDYWRKYHFLEGLSRYDTWQDECLSDDSLKALIKPKHFHDWSQAVTFKNKLFSLIDNHKDSIVVLSYVTGAHPSELEISNHFNQTFSSVSIHSREYNHALSKNKKRELLFVGKP